MPDTVAQTYQNHRRFLPLFHFVTATILVLNLLWQIYLMFRFFSPGTVIGVLTAAALCSLFYYLRGFPLRVQDRVIRLEERLRLARLLPADLQPRIEELSTGQLVALRFASDEELPELVQRVLTDNIRSREAIKQMIRSWRADHLRA